MDTVRPGFEKVTNTVQQNVTSNASTYAIIGGSVVGGIALLYGVGAIYSHYNVKNVQPQQQIQPTIMYTPPGKIDSQVDSRGIKSNYAVGKYNGNYKGWRRMTINEVNNDKYRLLAAHGETGWPLLEKPLECNGVLFVAEGSVRINKAYVTDVGFTFGKKHQLLDVYSAMDSETKVPWTDKLVRTEVAWTTMDLALSNEWATTEIVPTINPPCLFVRDAALPRGGKKTRRRKGSRKLKRGTRKH